MKKNWKGFLFSLFVFIFSTLAIIGLPLGWWPREPNQPFMAIIMFWIIQIAAALAFGELKEKLQAKPNYDCKDIRDENFFTIISMPPDFDEEIEKENFSTDYLRVDLHNFGDTLILFPLHKSYWHRNRYPRPGEVWIKKGNIFIFLQNSEKK